MDNKEIKSMDEIAEQKGVIFRKKLDASEPLTSINVTKSPSGEELGRVTITLSKLPNGSFLIFRVQYNNGGQSIDQWVTPELSDQDIGYYLWNCDDDRDKTNEGIEPADD